MLAIFICHIKSVTESINIYVCIVNFLSKMLLEIELITYHGQMQPQIATEIRNATKFVESNMDHFKI